jgi:hypothetical protein
MAELNYAIVCEYAKVIDDHVYIQGGGIDELRIAVPGLVPLAFAFELRFTEHECGRPHRLEMIIQGEDGDRVATLSATALPAYPDGVPPNWKVRAPLALMAPVPFSTPGIYGVHVLLNDQEVRDLQILVTTD